MLIIFNIVVVVFRFMLICIDVVRLILVLVDVRFELINVEFIVFKFF